MKTRRHGRRGEAGMNRRIEAATYGAWLAAEIQAAIDDPRPNIRHEEVMAEMKAEIAAIVRSKKRVAGGIGKA